MKLITKYQHKEVILASQVIDFFAIVRSYGTKDTLSDEELTSFILIQRFGLVQKKIGFEKEDEFPHEKHTTYYSVIKPLICSIELEKVFRLQMS